jgi:hypothetical protein
MMQKALNEYGLNQQQLNQQVESEMLVGFIRRTLTKIRLVPATLAVLIQGVALISVIALSWLTNLVVAINFDSNLSFSIFSLVLIQAFVSATLSYLAGMASWWRWIHLCFPIAAWGLSQWHVPNEIYLTGFIISLSLFWTTFRTQVPFFPSRPMVWQQVAKIIPQGKSVRLIDIGSGLGDMSMYMAKTRPDCQIEGIEIAPLPWMISYVRAKFRRSSAAFTLGNYQALDFANFDVIFAYLSPAAMQMLWVKASQEMRPGSLLISLEFEIPGVTESMRISGNKTTPTMYVWKIA